MCRNRVLNAIWQLSWFCSKNNKSFLLWLNAINRNNTTTAKTRNKGWSWLQNAGGFWLDVANFFWRRRVVRDNSVLSTRLQKTTVEKKQSRKEFLLKISHLHMKTKIPVSGNKISWSYYLITTTKQSTQVTWQGLWFIHCFNPSVSFQNKMCRRHTGCSGRGFIPHDVKATSFRTARRNVFALQVHDQAIICSSILQQLHQDVWCHQPQPSEPQNVAPAPPFSGQTAVNSAHGRFFLSS